MQIQTLNTPRIFLEAAFLFAVATVVAAQSQDLPPRVGSANEATDLWSLQPMSDPALPQVRANQWPRRGIDYFVLARLETENLSPVGDAGPRTLLRRVYFDLLGLPHRAGRSSCVCQ